MSSGPLAIYNFPRDTSPGKGSSLSPKRPRPKFKDAWRASWNPGHRDGQGAITVMSSSRTNLSTNARSGEGGL